MTDPKMIKSNQVNKSNGLYKRTYIQCERFKNLEKIQRISLQTKFKNLKNHFPKKTSI